LKAADYHQLGRFRANSRVSKVNRLEKSGPNRSFISSTQKTKKSVLGDVIL